MRCVKNVVVDGDKCERIVEKFDKVIYSLDEAERLLGLYTGHTPVAEEKPVRETNGLKYSIGTDGYVRLNE